MMVRLTTLFQQEISGTFWLRWWLDNRTTTPYTDVSGETRPRWRRGRQLSDGSRIYWWKEVLIVLVVDVVYETVRNIASAKPQKAYDNAIRLIGWQRDLGIWHEHGIQQCPEEVVRASGAQAAFAIPQPGHDGVKDPGMCFLKC